MRIRVVPVLAVLLWIGASGAARGAETIADPSAGKDALPTKEVGVSCNTIAAILTVYPTFVVETSEGPVQGVRGGPERVGCRVRAAGPATSDPTPDSWTFMHPPRRSILASY